MLRRGCRSLTATSTARPMFAIFLKGPSFDVNSNGIPDECEDCNDNGILDTEEITQGTSADCNGNSVPDECELESGIERLYVDHNAGGIERR